MLDQFRNAADARGNRWNLAGHCLQCGEPERLQLAGQQHQVRQHPGVHFGACHGYFRPGLHRIPQEFSGLPVPEPDHTSTQVTRAPAVTDISDGTAPWLSFAGSWGDGSFVLLGTTAGSIYAHLRVGDSPIGPAQHDIWRDPLLAFRSWPADDGH